MEPAKWGFLVCMLAMLLAPYIDRASGIISRKILQSSSNMTSAIAATEAEYIAWLQRVANRKPAASTTVFSTSAASDSAGVITVSQSGSADFTTVQDAIDSISSGNSARLVIQIAAGTYKEKVYIPSNKPYISFIGAGSDVTTITWNDTASSAGSTFNSGSVIIDSDYFIAQDISFENSAPAPSPGVEGKQAVALRISGDKAAFYSCSFYGAQDTLYDHQGRHYFKGCLIQGSIDFIFGDGQSYYYGCELNSIASSYGSITAQKRESPNEDTGFAFVHCKVTGSGMIYLGTAWGSYSRVVFLFTYIDDIILPEGWSDFGNSSHQETAFYGEYKCSGPGANSQNRVTWSYQLTAAQAAPFETISYIDGASWIEA